MVHDESDYFRDFAYERKNISTMYLGYLQHKNVGQPTEN